jgi:hypothetical protein
MGAFKSGPWVCKLIVKEILSLSGREPKIDTITPRNVNLFVAPAAIDIRRCDNVNNPYFNQFSRLTKAGPETFVFRRLTRRGSIPLSHRRRLW